MIKARPHSTLRQITFFGMTLDMSEYVGVQRRIAGKLENLLCVMTNTLSEKLFLHFLTLLCVNDQQRIPKETNEFTQ